MTQQTYTPADIVQFALNKDAVNISAAFDQMIGQRVADAVQARKIEVAKAMYGQQEVEQEVTAEVEDETQVDSEASDEVEATAEVEDENNKESEESHEDAEQSA